MILQTFTTPGLAINSYLIGDSNFKRALIIDPTRDLEPYLKAARNSGLEITDIAETHVHADFASGSKELKQRLQGKPTIHCSALGGEKWIPTYCDRKVKEGDQIQLGNIRLKALHTPGHTPEHLIWLCYEDEESPCLAFTGDLLFVGSVGRPDLLGEESKILTQQLYNSLFLVLATLPDFLEIYPAHGAGSFCGKGLSSRPTSTLGYERLYNPFLIKKPFAEWKQALNLDMPAVPPNFFRLKQYNLQGPIMETKNQTSLTIDLRDPESFARGHLTSSINIPLGKAFSNWASAILAQDTSLNLIAEKQEQIAEAMAQLRLIGFDEINRKIIWSEKELKDLEILPMVTVETLADKLKRDPKKVYVLDVRTPAEWNAGHIPEAHHIEMGNITKQLDQLPKAASIHVICGSGYRASVIASLLKQKGFPDVSNIRGGMNAWTALSGKRRGVTCSSEISHSC